MSKTLSERYADICNEYINKFCKKQGLRFEYWIGDTVGEIVLCSDFYFNFSDIIFDIDFNQPKGLIIKWYDYNLDANGKFISYKTFVKTYVNNKK